MKADLEAEVAALLGLHARDREAHFRSDAEMMFEQAGEEFIFVRDGKVSRSRREEDLARFRHYLAASRYYEWDDLEPPIVRVSDDASMAWIITRLKVRRGAIDPEGEETMHAGVYAGIMTYEKRDGRWRRVANVTTWE